MGGNISSFFPFLPMFSSVEDYVPENVPLVANSATEVVTKQAQQGEPGGHKPERISHQGPVPWQNSRFPSFKNQVSSIELEWGFSNKF